MTQFLIVGGGRAAAFAAEELRNAGFDGDLRLIASEHHIPYDHPPLSKGYLQEGSLGEVYLHPEDWYSENDIRLETGLEALSLDPVAHSLTVSGGRELPYDRLLFATGARSRLAGIPGEENVLLLRTLDEAKELRSRLADGGRRVVVIGSGWIGMEVAASARQLGNEVTVLGRGTEPLASAIGEELGAYLRRVHTDAGVDVRMSTKVAKITPHSVEREGSDPIDADVVIVAAGAEPNVELAAAAGLAVDDGILTDAGLATSAEHVFAAGDVANALHPWLGEHQRSEHWSHASDQGVVAAQAMLGRQASFDAIPYFFTDQFGFSMEFAGFSSLAVKSEVVYRGDRDSGEFVAFWVDGEGHVVAGMNVNVWDVNDDIQALIRSRKKVRRDRLADSDIDLSGL